MVVVLTKGETIILKRTEGRHIEIERIPDQSNRLEYKASKQRLKYQWLNQVGSLLWRIHLFRRN